MTRYRTDLTDIDLATHSPVELFAWCLSQHGESYDEAAAAAAKAAENLLLRFDAERDKVAPAAAEGADLPKQTQ